MATQDDTKQLRLAIIGGGLAGATLMNALTKYSHLDVRIYESAPEFSERGAAVGLATNAQRALEEISPEMGEALDKAGAGSGPDAGTIIFDLASENQGRVVHRAAFLNELLKPIPSSKMFTSKKLTKISTTSPDGEIILSFLDGTEEFVDAVIGADGIHGTVRECVLGAGHPALNPTFAGFWDCRALVPIARAREVLGDEYFKEARQYAWSGDGGFFMHDVLDNGETVQCVASVMTSSWDPSEWKRDLDREMLEEAFKSWSNGPIASGMINLLLENKELKAFPQWHFKENTPTYTKNRICIIGDAAHAMTPWQGSGAGQAIEDAMILQTLLQEVKNPQQIGAAFQAYDRVRRPRAQRIVESSQGTGRIICGREEGVRLDVEKLRGVLGSRWRFIYEIDLKKCKEEASGS
ncbi:hypothetical protein G7Y89_g13187 [Cudoniella acicularis]|uniref:FAD-binding domain-containing protein n=1 Tax=Cudoniella acicularis TaxID=354080 RepID=A0A8H4RAD2_9HELO|nr:hypothetical protein G7Y89_g13187 [Cudoniella acicularis]